jgi:hypothetical protein
MSDHKMSNCLTRKLKKFGNLFHLSNIWNTVSHTDSCNVECASFSSFMSGVSYPPHAGLICAASGHSFKLYAIYKITQ